MVYRLLHSVVVSSHGCEAKGPGIKSFLTRDFHKHHYMIKKCCSPFMSISRLHKGLTPRTTSMRNRDLETFAIEISKLRYYIQILHHRIMSNPYFQLISWKNCGFERQLWVYFDHKLAQKSITLKKRNFLCNELKIRIQHNSRTRNSNLESDFENLNTKCSKLRSKNVKKLIYPNY